MTESSKRVETVRVTATVPKPVVDTWRQVAAIQGQSLSALVAEWMAELEPGLLDVLRLRAAWEAADSAQRAVMRSAVTATGDQVQDTMLTSWDAVRTLGSDHVE